MGKAICGPAGFLEQCLPGNETSFGRLGSGAATEEFRTTGGYAAWDQQKGQRFLSPGMHFAEPFLAGKSWDFFVETNHWEIIQFVGEIIRWSIGAQQWWALRPEIAEIIPLNW